MLFSSLTEFLAPKYGIEAAVDMLIDAGYEGIDISMFDIHAFPFTDDYMEICARIKAKADAAGVKFVQAHAPFGGYEFYTKECIPLMPRVFDTCRLLGIPVVVVHPIMRGHYYGFEEEHFNTNMEYYRALAPLARTNHVKIALENMWEHHPITHRIRGHVMADPAELCRYYDTLNDPEVFTICLDIGHVAICGREPADAIKQIGHDRLGAIHAHDVDYINDCHTLPGTMKINWDSVCRALGEIDYVGNFNLEADSFFANFPAEHHATVARFMADTARCLANKVDLYRA